MSDSRNSDWILLIVALLGCLTVLFLTFRFGVGITFDSLVYIGVSKSLLSAEGYSYHGGVYHQQSPLYPTLLAVLDFGGLDPADASRLLNAIAFGLILFVSGKWLRETTQSLRLALLGSAAILVSIPLLQGSIMAWTETLFIALLSLFFLQFHSYLREERLRVLVGAGILVSLACLTKYAGVALVFSGVITLLLRRDWPINRRLFSVTVFGVISTLPTVFWLVRNLILEGTLTGVREPSHDTLMDNLYLLFDVISRWFLPSVLTPVVRLGITFVFLGVVVSFVTALIGNSRAGSRIGSLLSVLSFFLAYPVVILYAATTVRITPLNDRYLSPLVGPLILLLCVAFDGTRDYPRFSPKLRLMLKVIFGFGLVLMLLNGLFTEAQVPIEGEEGAGIVFMQKYDAPGSAQVFREVGMTLAEQELFSQAGGWFQRELELTPDSYDAHNQFGVVLMELGSFSQALIHFQRATQINPNRVEAYTNIGLCLIQEGQVDEAAEFFAGMIEIQPDNIPMYVNLGSVREGQEKLQEAIDLYREALRRKPDDETVRARLDSLLLRRGSE